MLFLTSTTEQVLCGTSVLLQGNVEPVHKEAAALDCLPGWELLNICHHDSSAGNKTLQLEQRLALAFEATTSVLYPLRWFLVHFQAQFKHGL